LVALAAVVRGTALTTAVAALVLAVLAYITGQRMPDRHIPIKLLGRVCGPGMLVLAAGIAGLIIGTPSSMTFSLIIMGYCSGSRIKAAGIGKSSA
jgi:hypothetical protein